MAPILGTFGATAVRGFRSIISSFSTFLDTFSTGFKSGWVDIISGWTATTTANASIVTNYPLKVVPMSNENTTITIKTTGSGTGASLWVTDSGEWWSVVTQQELCSGCGACTTYNAYNPCGSGGTCVATGGTCVATGGNCVPSGGNCIGSGGTCVATGGTCVASFVAGFCTFNPCGTSNPVVCNPVYYTTNAGFYTCSMYNPTGFCKFGFFTAGTTNGPFGGSCSGGNCLSTYSCNPDSYNPCASTNPYNPCGSTNPYNPCSSTNPYNPCASISAYNPCGSTNPYNPCGSTNPCVGTGGTCATSANTYPRYLRIFKYITSTFTQVATLTLDSLTNFPALAALKVVVTNSNKAAQTATITASAFSDASMVTKIGNDLIHNATGVKVITNYGIIAVPSSYNQSTTITEINIV
jgi:hypothetical protein